MNKNIQPELHDIVAHCACGKEYKTRSTNKEIKVTLCSGCHPFFTGATRFIDTAGRIEKFEKRYKKAQEAAAAAAKKAVETPTKGKKK